jgi:uncharacterized coiled-coil protein SlyX
MFILFGFSIIPNSNAENLITNQYFNEISGQPERFEGVWAKLSGSIENKQVYENTIGYVFTVGGVEGTENQAWVVHDKSNNSFSIGDCFIIEGEVQGSTELENRFGANWDVPWIWVEKYTEIGCLEAMYPTIAESNVSQTQEFSSAKITVEKIQNSKENTRVFFTVENNSNDLELTVETFSSVLIQDRTSSKTAYVYEEYDELEYTIPYGTVGAGWLVFEQVEDKPFEIRLPVSLVSSDFMRYEETELIFQINSMMELNYSAPTPTSTTPDPVEITPPVTSQTNSPSVSDENKIQELEKQIQELESANKKLQSTIDELQSKLAQSGDSPPKTKKEIASFVDKTKDPQSYVDRYKKESSYKEWFDENYSDYDSIYEAVGKRQPVPDWIKNNAIWWSEGKLSEDEFVGGIEYLVKNNIINVD